ncbi:MAG: AraC family transcriptional regulator [Pseudomonadota bacterium]
MTLFSRPPFDPRLSGFVRCFWYCEQALAHGTERVLPTGAAQIVVDLNEPTPTATSALIVGPQTSASLIETSAMHRAVGAAFRVGGAAPWIGGSCANLTDETVDLEALWGADAGRLWHALMDANGPVEIVGTLERFLSRRLVETASPNGAIRQSVRGLAHGQPVAAAIEASGMARATFGRLFTNEVGLSPKRWAGIARFQRAVRCLAEGAGPLADVAAACGYADQAHLTRAFRRYGGITPAGYRPRSTDAPNHLSA